MTLQQDESTPQLRGVLDEKQFLNYAKIRQIEPADALSDCVAFHWFITWDIPVGTHYCQSNLPHPTCHLVLDPQKTSGLFGCTTGRFDYNITGSGIVLGTKFHPGGASAFVREPLTHLSDTEQPLDVIFGSRGQELPRALAEERHAEEILSRLTPLLLEIKQPLNEDAILARRLVEKIESDRTLVRVSDLADEAGLNIRKLQRLFFDKIGVSPKWVIDRYRMFDALDAMKSDESVDLADLAHRLAYTDQAHFSARFKALTGDSPGAYANRQ
ncbi:MAG: AraC family transcriptional regulator [Cohaesibacteraceae bacterium]|nr:AraC family transcriptional regulator [Cohaesibacteraceae bacterium]MBL4876279.1 AraC family transcriptional regulator [Cohaesibacteraceae bacterium]